MSNLYIKIIRPGFANFAPELLSIGGSTELIPVPQGHSFEICDAILQVGTFIRLKEKGEIYKTIFTDGIIYIQEGATTIGNHSSNEYAMREVDGRGVESLFSALDEEEKIVLPAQFYENASPELIFVAERILTRLNVIPRWVLDQLPDYEYFPISTVENITVEPAWMTLTNAVKNKVGIELLASTGDGCSIKRILAFRPYNHPRTEYPAFVPVKAEDIYEPFKVGNVNMLSLVPAGRDAIEWLKTDFNIDATFSTVGKLIASVIPNPETGLPFMTLNEPTKPRTRKRGRAK